MLKLIHFFVLLCYINILAYEAGGDAYVVDQDSILNGESILEFVLDDVLDLPINKEAQDVEILYDEYRSHSYQHHHLVPVFIIVFGLLLVFKYLSNDRKHPFYDNNKKQVLLGYDTFLHRFKLF